MEEGERKYNEDGIPILRTYKSDLYRFKKGKDNIELRKLLVREQEKSRKEKELYKEKAREIFKESSSLKKKIEKIASKKNIEKEEASLSFINKNEIKDAIHKTADNLSEKNKIDFSKNREIEKKAVLKRELEEETKGLDNKKMELKDMGLRAMHIKNYKIGEEVGSKKISKEAIITVVIIFFLSLSLGAIIYSINITKENERENIEREQVETNKDIGIVKKEDQIFINIESGLDTWREALYQNVEEGVLIKIIPFEKIGDVDRQIDLNTLIEKFSIKMPNKLMESLNEYYFLGKYQEKGEVITMLVLPISNYGDAFVSTLAWEKHIINELHNLFPRLEKENSLETKVSTIDIENKSLKIIKNNKSQLIYYFYNKNVLVFLNGKINTKLFSKINDVIRFPLTN